jgi:hypothetical protein
MANGDIKYLPVSSSRRVPKTGREHATICLLDFKAFETLQASVQAFAEDRDPAYLKYVVRKIWFLNFCEYINSPLAHDD